MDINLHFGGDKFEIGIKTETELCSLDVIRRLFSIFMPFFVLLTHKLYDIFPSLIDVFHFIVGTNMETLNFHVDWMEMEFDTSVPSQFAIYQQF